MKDIYFNSLQATSRLGQMVANNAGYVKPSVVATAGKAVEAVQKVLKTTPAVVSVISAPPLLPVVQSRWWGFLESPFIQAQLRFVILLLLLKLSYNAYSYLFSKAAQYFRRKKTTSNLGVVVSKSKATQNRHEDLIKKLSLLATHFRDKMQTETTNLEQANQSMASTLHESTKLQSTLDAFTENDLNAVLGNLAHRLGDIVAKQEKNLPILLAVMEDLEEAKKDLAKATQFLEETKNEFEVLYYELLALESLVKTAGLKQNQELEKLLKKVEGIKNVL